jgi:hypothetical protein
MCTRYFLIRYQWLIGYVLEYVIFSFQKKEKCKNVSFSKLPGNELPYIELSAIMSDTFLYGMNG